MNSREGADRRMVLDDDVACQRRGVRQNDMISQDTVVRNVAVSHDKIVVANDGASAALRRAAMYGDILAKDVVVSNDEFSRFAFVLQVLRRKPDRAKRKKTTPPADPRRTLNDYMFVH